MKTYIRILMGLVLLPSLAKAQDRLFNYTYQSNVLNPKEKELEAYNTFSLGKEDFYRAYQSKLEFETGISRHLQASFYLISQTSTGYNLNKDSALSSASSFAVANEWKYKISDPVANAIGSALYTEFELSKDAFAWENKIILDKKLGQSTLALNLVGELESGKILIGKQLARSREFNAEVHAGYAYQVAKGWNLGVEARNINTRSDGTWEASNLFAGPVVSYFRDEFWVNLTVMPQLHSFAGTTRNGLDLDRFTKWESRLSFSFEL